MTYLLGIASPPFVWLLVESGDREDIVMPALWARRAIVMGAVMGRCEADDSR